MKTETKHTPKPLPKIQLVQQGHDFMMVGPMGDYYGELHSTSLPFRDALMRVIRQAPLLEECKDLLLHIEAMTDDAYLTGHPEFVVIAEEAKQLLAKLDEKGNK